MIGNAWNESEVNATVEAYFTLLDRQSAGQKFNKKELYRKLSSRFPTRTEKAFELKFQNISAILYEEHLPYCDGLKPKLNYQHLLKLLVLDHLNRNPLPVQSPKEILIGKLESLNSRGYLPVEGSGSGRFGLAIEKHLGIPPNSDKGADFMGIELKTKHDKSLQTLFSRTPLRYVACENKKELVEGLGYWDTKRNRQALYTSFSSKQDSLGFSLQVESDSILVKHTGNTILEYGAEQIESALLSKHSQTAFINLGVKREDKKTFCRLESVSYCKWPSIIRFLKLIAQGDIFLDFTMSIANGRVRDHGFLWRIRSERLPDLYLDTELTEFQH